MSLSHFNDFCGEKNSFYGCENEQKHIKRKFILMRIYDRIGIIKALEMCLKNKFAN